MMTHSLRHPACTAAVLCAFAVVWSAHAADDWIQREKIRAGWIYCSDGVDKVQSFRELGMNTIIVSARNGEEFDKWAREAKRTGMHLFGVLGFSGQAQEAGARRAVFGNGYESVVTCPTDERFWDQQIIGRAAQLARDGLDGERQIDGVLIDFELYANSNKGGQIYYTDACFCDHCFGSFLTHQKLDSSALQTPLAARKAWLSERAVDVERDYHALLRERVRAVAGKMRRAVESVRSDFYLGFYPRPHNWMLVGTAQGLGTAEHPMILWATSTYGGGGPARIEDDWRAQMLEQDIHSYYCAGMLLRFYTSVNLATNVYLNSKKSNGYWLFTLHTLCIPEDRQKGDFYLAHGTREDYRRALRRANDELDSLCANPDRETELAYTDEPFLYRQTGNGIHQFKVPTLRSGPGFPAGREIGFASLPLLGTQYLMTRLAAGAEALIQFRADKQGDPYVWGVSYAVIDDAKTIITAGKMPPGEDTAVRFSAARDGLYTVVVVPGYYGRCMVVGANVPLALWTGATLEVSRPGGTVNFLVPAGIEAFSMAARCHWGSEAVRLVVTDPEGQVVQEEDTDPYVRSLATSIPTRGKTDGVWSLSVKAVPGKRYRSAFITFDKRLPQVVGLSPELLPARRSCVAFRVRQNPVVDGRIDGDPAWESTPTQHQFLELRSLTKAAKQTTFRLGYSDEALFLGVHCDEPAPEELRTSRRDDDVDLWKDDSIEVFLRPGGEAERYAHFIVNAAAARRSKFGLRGGSIPLAWDAAAQRDADSYSIELRIPFKLLGARPQEAESWSVNVCRNNTVGLDRFATHTTWAHVTQGFHDPTNFGTLLLASVPSGEAVVQSDRKQAPPAAALPHDILLARSRLLLDAFLGD